MSEERAGLDARGSARERLMGEIVFDGGTLFGSTSAEMEQRLDAIEAEAIERYRAGMKRATREAVAAYKTGFAEAVRALPRLAWVHDGMDGLTGTQPDGRYLDRAAVLALLEPKP